MLGSICFFVREIFTYDDPVFGDATVYEGVSKWVTIESKTAVMDVIDLFVCITR
jgi:hypothetical protein